MSIRGNSWEALSRDRNPSTAELSWAAGLFEGEGAASRGGGSEIVQVTQNDPWILDRLRAMFGGSVRKLNRTVLLNGKKYSGGFQWVITGARARGFLMTIYGLLSPRRQQQTRIALGKDAA